MKLKAITLLLVSTLIFGGCQAKEEVSTAAPETIIPVSVQAIQKGEISSQITYAGRINPSETVSVSSKMAGKVKAVLFDVGDRVNANDTLFTLDEVDVRNQIKQIESQINIAEQGVKSAENSLSTVTGGQYSSQLLQIESQIKNYDKQLETAEINLKNSEIALNNANDALANVEKQYNNSKTLYEAGSLAKNDFEKSELGYKQAKAGVEQATLGNSQAKVSYDQVVLGLAQAKESYALTTGQVTDENKQRAELGVNQAQASKSSAQVQLDIARRTLEDTTVKAPISGVITSRNAKVSEFTSTQVPAFTIIDMDTVNVEVKISELIINHVEINQEVNVFINTISHDPIKGKIISISPAADQTSTYPIKISIDNKNGIIKPGMFAEVKFDREKSTNTIVLPRNAVFEDQTNSFVYLNENGLAKKVIVKTGIDNGEEIEVTSGLTQGNEVVVKGQNYLNDGDKINVVK